MWGRQNPNNVYHGDWNIWIATSTPRGSTTQIIRDWRRMIVINSAHMIDSQTAKTWNDKQVRQDYVGV